MTARPPASVATASVNYNTKLHVARALFSLHTTVAEDVASIVIVDNGSTDGSVELLDAAAEAGLCTVIRNVRNRYHGPALNQAVRHVRDQAEGVRYLWVLDSDCVVLEPGLVQQLTRLADTTRAAIVGEASWNQWHGEPRLGNYSLFLDLGALSDAGVLTFDKGGDPSESMQRDAGAAGLGIVTFPFAASGSLIHVGRATLRGVAGRGETDNRLFDWAREKNEPHYQEIPGAHARYDEFCAGFDAAVPDLTGPGLVEACLSARP